MNQRIIITNEGTLQLIQEPCPDLGEYEVRIKVLATGVAFADLMMRKGKYPGAPLIPFTPGHEVVGFIESIGSKVSQFQKGQVVAAFCKYGGYTRYINLPEKQIVPLPLGIDPYEAAAILLNYVTAYQLLHRVGCIKEGDSLLIHGAAGGVGSALLQLCKGLNLTIFGTASIKNESKIRSTEAKFIDYQSEDFVERIKFETNNGVDIVFDAIGGYHWKRSYQALKPNGNFIGYGLSYASQNNVIPEENIFMNTEWKKILSTGRTYSGHRGKIYSLSKADPDEMKEDLQTLFNLLLIKKIKPQIAEKLPLGQATQAHRLFEEKANGKILLLCQE